MSMEQQNQLKLNKIQHFIYILFTIERSLSPILMTANFEERYDNEKEITYFTICSRCFDHGLAIRLFFHGRKIGG